MDCTCAELTPLQHAAGFITFVNVMWVIAVGLGVVCIGMLAAFYARELKNVPKAVWEGLLYLSGLGLTVGGALVDSVAAEFIGLAGVCLFGLGLGFSANWRRWKKPTPILVMFSIVGCAVAVAYDSYVLGTLGIIATMITVGVGLAFERVIDWFGDHELLYVSAIAFFFVGIYVLGEVAILELGALAVFGPGAIYLGAWAGFGSLVFSASTYRTKLGAVDYLVLQPLTALICVGGMAVGEVLSIPDLAENAGSFFVLWLFSKFIDIPKDNVPQTAFIGLAAAASVWCVAWFARTHPDLVGPYLLGFGA